MKKREIIGHRGAAGMELENTATSLRRAVSLDLAAVEFDVRLTKDQKLVLAHDGDLVFMADDPRRISDLTLKELKEISLVDGSHLLTLPEALTITQQTPTIIEIKDHGSGRLVLDEIKKFPEGKFTIASRQMDELALLRDLDQNLRLFLIEDTKPIECIHFARQLKLNGVGMFYWILNPLTYWYAKRSGLSIYVYTVNHRFLTSFLGWFYPDVAICTNHPEWYVKRRRLAKKKRKRAERREVLERHRRKKKAA
jgi:glycerophosphoryl diester phosphodiesterase